MNLLINLQFKYSVNAKNFISMTFMLPFQLTYNLIDSNTVNCAVNLMGELEASK